MLRNAELVEDCIVVSVIGELDLKVAEGLRTSLDELIFENPNKELVLDFSDVNFIDSSGLGVLLGRYKKLHSVGKSIFIRNVQPQVKRVLELSGITRLIKVSDYQMDF